MSDFSSKLDSTLTDLDSLLRYLTQIKIYMPNDLSARYRILESIYSIIRPKLRKPEDRENGEKTLIILLEELNLHRAGSKETKFIHLANLFEWELREFIENNNKNAAKP